MKYIKAYEAAPDLKTKLLTETIFKVLQTAFNELEIPNKLKVSSYDVVVFYKRKNRRTGIIKDEKDSIMHLYRRINKKVVQDVSLMFFEYSADGGWGGLYQDPRLTIIYDIIKNHITNKKGVISWEDITTWNNSKQRQLIIDNDYIDNIIQYFDELIYLIPTYLNANKYNL
jgi:hypothetical protein